MKTLLRLLPAVGWYLSGTAAAPVAEALPATATQTAAGSASTSNPCAVLAAAYAAQTGTTQTLKPSQVLACMRTVPIAKDTATGLVNYLQTFIPFQSTLSYLKNPPSGYAFPAVDLLGGLQTIQNNINSGGYTNEWDFEYDVFNLMQSSRDGHLTVWPFLVGSVGVTRQPVVSISDNGNDLPKVYFRCKSQFWYLMIKQILIMT